MATEMNNIAYHMQQHGLSHKDISKLIAECELFKVIDIAAILSIAKNDPRHLIINEWTQQIILAGPIGSAFKNADDLSSQRHAVATCLDKLKASPAAKQIHQTLSDQATILEKKATELTAAQTALSQEYKNDRAAALQLAMRALNRLDKLLQEPTILK
jgi:hypothetical protein